MLAHLSRPDGEAALLHRSAEATAAGLEAEHAGECDSRLRLVRHYRRIRELLLDALFSPMPPVRAWARLLLGRLGARDGLETARLLAPPAHRMGAELFDGRGGRALLAGNAAHADIPAVAAGSGVFAWLLAMLAQEVGFPVPHGGAGRFALALASRARQAGAQLRTGTAVTRVVVRGGRALGVRCADGTSIRARRAVLATCSVPSPFGSLVEADQLPAGVHRALHRFSWDTPTVKVNWALDAPVPWRAAGAATAGCIHLGADADELAEWSTALTIGRPSLHTFALLGKMAVADPARAPAGGRACGRTAICPRARPPRPPPRRSASGSRH